MAERNTAHTPHSIPWLIYVEINGKAKGFKQALLREEVTGTLKQFLICPECKGIIREAIQYKGRTVCQACTTGSPGDSDQNVQASVPLLKCRCPLYQRGCDWSGELGAIKEHMDTCLKLLVECNLKCGVIMERGAVEEHQRETCPIRMMPYEYCGQNIQASKENKHTRVCLHHPEGEIACPYKEIGCDTIGLLRKHLERHLKENLIGHHKLILAQFQQQQRGTVELRDRVHAMQTHRVQDTSAGRRNRSVSVGILLFLFTVLTAGISVLVWYQVENNQRLERVILKLGNDMKRKELEVRTIIETFANETKSRFDLMLASVEDVEVRFEQSKHIDLLEQLQTVTNRLPPISRYIRERDKILQGVGWTHVWMEEEHRIDGPNFYLTGLCRLQLHVKFSQTNGRFQPRYFVTRVIGDYDEVVESCHISYFYHFYENLETGTKSTMLGEYKGSDLGTGDLLYIHYFYYEIEFKHTGLIQKDMLTVKVYFDTEENE